ncbi:TraR/DksA family transcriptional regulator [Pseudoclavibacter soli]|uniref:TraR/DksA family transcriptional regulator n=1 Tax=Pseudoclavibacter soli TaxID=452623 RepID=UPI00041022CE|nr:TraR/DksA C4-type zinc finger protein [Pseudoclavibacter soli]
MNAAPDDQSQRLRQLLAEADSREQQARNRLAEVRSLQQGQSADDEHDPDGVPVSFEWSKAQAMLEQAVAERERLQRAVDAAARGAYGVCAVCGREIDARRLAARPDATLCIECARAQELQR